MTKTHKSLTKTIALLLETDHKNPKGIHLSKLKVRGSASPRKKLNELFSRGGAVRKSHEQNCKKSFKTKSKLKKIEKVPKWLLYAFI